VSPAEDDMVVRHRTPVSICNGYRMVESDTDVSSKSKVQQLRHLDFKTLSLEQHQRVGKIPTTLNFDHNKNVPKSSRKKISDEPLFSKDQLHVDRDNTLSGSEEIDCDARVNLVPSDISSSDFSTTGAHKSDPLSYNQQNIKRLQLHFGSMLKLFGLLLFLIIFLLFHFQGNSSLHGHDRDDISDRNHYDYYDINFCDIAMYSNRNINYHT